MTTDAIDQEHAQPSLIPLSAEELEAAGKKLAEKVRELEEMKEDHAEQRTEMQENRKALEAEISSIASTIRQHGR
jgi:predicted  nucleic acid-binding Zn-ribbon protein